MNFNEQTKTSEYIYKGKILNLRRDSVLLPSGNDGIREIVEHGGGSCVLCVKDRKVLFVKQFRYAYGQELLEIPAGKHDKGESPEQTAIRELNEECGLKAKSAVHLFDIYPSPGYTNEIINLFYVKDFEDGSVKLDEDEFLTSIWIDVEKVREMLYNGEIKDGKTLIALLYFLDNQGKFE